MTWFAENQPLIATAGGVLALVVLVVWTRMNAFAALILVSIFSAIAAGMGPEQAMDTIVSGMGGTLGFIAVVIGLGALFGAILESSGGVTALANQMLHGRGPAAGRWGMGMLGLIAAIPVFLDVALIVLAPLVFAMAARVSKPAMTFALPLLAGLAVGHALIPPTPGPIAVAEILETDLGWMIGFGLLVGAVTMPIAGPIYAGWLDRKGWMPVGTAHHAAGEEEPAAPVIHGTAAAVLILLPLVLILAGTLAVNLIPADAEGSARWVRQGLYLAGHPFVALLAACGLAMLFFRGAGDAQRHRLRTGISRALEPTGAVILVTGAGGAFKQVLVDTGAGTQLANAALAFGMTPLIAAYVLAVLIRVAQGSATVAMITAAGLVAPIATAADLSAPERALVAIAVACGATALSHVNDSGFWLVNRIFGLSERETFRTWTVTATLVSVVGFACASVLMLLLEISGG